MSVENASPRRVPAEPELWILVFGDLAIFTVFFFVWATTARAHPAAFHSGRATLDQAIGITNTVLLLTSSAAVAGAVRLLRAARTVTARRWYLAAIGLGAAFLVLKVVEYAEHLSCGLAALHGPFFLDYFLFTGVHALHVLLGLVALAVVRSRARGDAPSMLAHEAVATYWHMIDVVWIVLFSLIYLTAGA